MQTTNVQQSSCNESIEALKAPSGFRESFGLKAFLKQNLPFVAGLCSFLAATNAEGANIVSLLCQQRPGEPNKIDFIVSDGDTPNLKVLTCSSVITAVDPALYLGVEFPLNRFDLSGSTFTQGTNFYLCVNSTEGTNVQFTVVYTPATTKFIIGNENTAISVNLTNSSYGMTFCGYGWVSSLIPCPACPSSQVVGEHNAQWGEPIVSQELKVLNYSFTPSQGAKWTISLKQPGLVTALCYTNDINSTPFVLQTNWASAGVSSYTNRSMNPTNFNAAFLRLRVDQ